MEISPNENPEIRNLQTENAPEKTDANAEQNQPEEQEKASSAVHAAKKLTEADLRESFSSFLHWILISAGVLVAAVLALLIVLYVKKLKAAEDISSSQVETETNPTELETINGVLLQVDSTKITVYNADTQEEYSFDLAGTKRITDAYGMAIDVADILTGDIAEVRYYPENGKVELFRLSPQSTVIKDVSGITFEGEESRESQESQEPQESQESGWETDPQNVLTVAGKSYTYDDQLMLTYHGSTINISDITENMVLELLTLGNHVYTIRVVCGEGIVRFSSLPTDYFGATMTLTPELGPEKQMEINAASPLYIAMTEGLCNYVIETEDGELLNSGSIYVPGQGKNVILTLLPLEKEQGIIHFTSNVSSAQITINEKKYSCGDDIELTYGKYEAVVTAKGYSEAAVQIVVEQPYKTYVVNMNALRSYLVVSSRFRGVVVTIGDEEPFTLDGNESRVPLEPGTYTVRAELEGCEPLEVTVEIRANEADKVIFFSDFKQIQENESGANESGNESAAESEDNSEDESDYESGNESETESGNEKEHKSDNTESEQKGNR